MTARARRAVKISNQFGARRTQPEVCAHPRAVGHDLRKWPHYLHSAQVIEGGAARVPGCCFFLGGGFLGFRARARAGSRQGDGGWWAKWRAAPG
jgi:hypothetical protein